ncbi:hypothetical protein SAMN05192561_11213 [Halopenitus malekzadehii]|uniref:Uncharacterized protein n=1 Tax=Halopenitus malekzadehii TaxID=1267564 RepID=A0A1H6JLC3_9EURY|nr:hypothetical protein [Halopenitus malekzadehii]SEH60549.1 hypothetical protein SAMN05192561_11213 [Halopenitus malekzadehii]
MVSGEVRLYDPGEKVDVEVVADSTGALPGRGDPVQLTGEDGGKTQVKLVETDGDGVGALLHDNHLDDEADVAAGEVAGPSTFLATGPIDWYDESDGENLSVNDVVVLTSDGVRAYVDADDTVDMQYGRVFATGTRATAATAQKVAVLRYK